jgi:hypothetical protein
MSLNEHRNESRYNGQDSLSRGIGERQRLLEEEEEREAVRALLMTPLHGHAARQLRLIERQGDSVSPLPALARFALGDADIRGPAERAAYALPAGAELELT